MKKIELEKKVYQKPDILAIIYVEEELMQHLSGWDDENGPEGGVNPEPEEGEDDWGGGT